MITFNGLIVDFIAVGGAVILTGLGMGIVLMFTENKRGELFWREFPARFRHAVRDPGGSASEWTRPLHAAAPSALRAARHLAGLGHLLPRVSPWRAAMIARNLAARATRARKPTSWEGMATEPRHAEGAPGQQGSSGGQGSASTGALALATAPEGHHKPLGVPWDAGVEAGAYQVAHPPRSGQRVTSRNPAAAGGVSPDALPPLPGLPAEIPAPDCDYPPWAPWPGDDTITRGLKAVR